MPNVSVILPVYNGQRFLKEAIDSILTQTFTDFELLIINDGSVDNSETIIQSYNDDRIVYLKNETNQGLIYSLNRAIDLAKGEFIARMDADDLSLPGRLEKQVAMLQLNPNIGILATTINYIDENNTLIGNWKLDRDCVDEKTIRNIMPWDCCIAHPTVMGKATVFKRFKYNFLQKHIEDYDLWLRLLDSNIRIAKIAEPLLQYRVHSSSITQFSKTNFLPLQRIFRCKRLYLFEAVKQFKFSLFNLKVFIALIRDGIVIIKKKVVG